MLNKPLAFIAAALCSVVAFSGPVAAAEPLPAADPTQPVTTPRIGGSPADAAFRDAMQKSGVDFRAARAACRAQPPAERGTCISAARAQLKRTRVEAKAAHDAARKAH